MLIGLLDLLKHGGGQDLLLAELTHHLLSNWVRFAEASEGHLLVVGIEFHLLGAAALHWHLGEAHAVSTLENTGAELRL